MKRLKTITAEGFVSCRIITVDEVRGTHVVTFSPQTIEEVLENHGDVRTAKDWAEHCELRDLCNDGGEPLAVCLRHSVAECTITIRWHAVDDQAEAAAVVLKEVLSGTWRACS